MAERIRKMTGSNSPQRCLSLAHRRYFFIMLLIATTLLINGCKKADFIIDNSNSSENPSQSSNSNENDIKGQADSQGQATKPDKGNFTVKYSDVKNPRYAEVNEKFRQQRFLESIADELNATIAIPENVYITFKECGQPN